MNIWKYKDLITNFHKKKPNFVKIEQNLTSEKPSINNTVARLVGKCSPYGKEEFKEISLRAFLSTHVRELFTNWEDDQTYITEITDAVNEVIENLKFEYPKLQKWDNLKIINHISTNWSDRVNIQANMNKKILEFAKSTDLQEREELDPENNIDIDDNNEILILMTIMRMIGS